MKLCGGIGAERNRDAPVEIDRLSAFADFVSPTA